MDEASRTRSFVRRVCVAIFVGAILAMLATKVYPLGVHRPSLLAFVELPLVDVNAICVDADSSIYIASPSYDRIQVYDQRGRFVRAIYTRDQQLGADKFNFGLDSAQRLVVTPRNGGKSALFDKNGFLEWKDPKEVQLIARGTLPFAASDGTTYSVVESWWSPTTVIRTSARDPLAVSQNWILWLVRPFPLMALGVIAGVVGRLLYGPPR